MNFIASWALFYLGHAISKMMNAWPWDRAHPYPLYNWLMCKSSDIQGDGKGPWKAP